MKLFVKILLIIGIIFSIGIIIPYSFQNPVEGGSRNDYNPQSYWYFPWGTSVTHKGVDIFKKRGTTVHPASGIEWVLYAGHMPGKGGNVVITLAPKWRLHYYAHLDKVDASPLAIVSHESRLGSVGNSGNAAKTPSHLHLGIMSLIPNPMNIDDSRQGWKKTWYMNPIPYLNSYHEKKDNRKIIAHY